MVHNPIYEGPLYETLETQFETLSATAAVNTLTHQLLNTSYNETTTHTCSNASPNRRYVEQSRHTCSPQNQPSLSLAYLSSSTVRCHSEGVAAGCSGNDQETDRNLVTTDVSPDMDEKYIIMTLANTAMDMVNGKN